LPLRGSATTHLKDAGVDRIMQLYVTGHSLAPEILRSYVSVWLKEGMAAYSRHIEPLWRLSSQGGHGSWAWFR
jgi:hypothetical protein